MSTIFEIKRNTAKLLEELKQKYNAKSADEKIRKLIEKAGNVPESMFDAHPKMKRFTQSEESQVHEL